MDIDQTEQEDTVADLHNQLENAITEERYEEAAVLRDKILKLKKGEGSILA